MDESDESYDPILPEEMMEDRPRKAAIPPPLPRMWKSPPDEDEVAAAQAKKKVVDEVAPKKPKPRAASAPVVPRKKKAQPEVDDGTGASKLEETPVFDTVEARQRARWLVGGLLAVIVTVFGFLIVGAFRGGENQDIRDGEPPDLRTLSTEAPKSSGEVEARNLLDNARQADKQGKPQAAVNLLTKVTKTYPNTAAAREALHALDRNRVDKPLFGDDLPQQADGPNKPPDAKAALAGGPTPPPPPSTNPAIPTPNASKPDPPKTTDNSAKAPPPTAPVVTPSVAQIRPLPGGYRPNFDAPIHSSGWPTRIFSDRDGAEMVLIPAGAFDMGRGDGEPQEGPVHPVSLSAYYIDKTEVTVRQYLRFLKESGRSLEAVKKGMPKGIDAATFENYPITGISWKEADAFCTWAHRDLPTEAQWELAARSSEGKISFWNGELPRKDPEKGPRPMNPVMSLPSDLAISGAFDLGANAWEWTADLYDSQYYQQFRNLAIDPAGPKKSQGGLVMRTVRGGSKGGFLTWREGQKIEVRAPYLGFRGALNVETPATAPASTTTNPGNQTPGPGSSKTGGVQPF